ncbi:hypothetical protein CYLTODRAFT_458831 [Cylindrobasidium torrendii FP15055 ss-10]|uniref:Uncharacterized protein n=1 Tax=Cylindrobasidium torrendii FP15055 ss-10 TaxID=1314674 RepID=A0A0D7AW48_9AGAR|nr:hypothetical protein CYLTODRAFT_458831 [Cylindrobasidium torrendii FP15055 ss-10]
MSSSWPQTIISNLEMADQFRAYDFENDIQFQQGMASILSQNPAPDVLMNAKLFYFNRIAGVSLTPADIHSQSASESSSVTEDTPQTLTFAQLKDLIESGRTDEIPNNKPISGELNTAPPSVSLASARRKPWEKGEGTESNV